MGLYLNPSPDAYEMDLNSEIYIDKSNLIDELNKKINTMNRYVCISRPRRFGKTVTAHMLSAYYCKEKNTRDLFKNLKISQTPLYNEHINKYNVIFLTMTDFFCGTDDVKKSIETLENKLIRELRNKYKDIYFEGITLIEFLGYIHSDKKDKFVFIIDEWDDFLREHMKDLESFKIYLDYLFLLLKDKPYIALAYMTGILPIKKYGRQSALNMFDEYTMINMGKFTEYTGFTDLETKNLCKKYNQDFLNIQQWYDGYIVNGTHIYNPKAVTSAISHEKISNYWTSTETYEALKIYINYDKNGLHDAIVKLLSGERISIDSSKFQNDMTTFTDKDDVLTLLVHLGYLGYIENTSTQGEVYIPNEELRQQFYGTVGSIEDLAWSNVVNALKRSDRILQATLNCQEDSVAAYIEEFHSGNTPILQYNDENSLSCVVTIAYYTAVKYYNIIREMPTGKGFADIVFIPHQGVNKPAIIMELKYDVDAKVAINQIIEKNYMQNLQEYSGNILLVAISYDKRTKKHECIIVKDSEIFESYDSSVESTVEIVKCDTQPKISADSINSIFSDK